MKQHAHNAPNFLPQLVLWLGDVLVILSFVWIGRSSHNLNGDVLASLWTALPFLLGWVLVMPWFGIYNRTIATSWKQVLPRLLGGWLIAGGLALLLRALLLGRSLSGGIMPTFAAVSMGYIGLVALAWRLAYAWWANRQIDHKTSAGS